MGRARSPRGDKCRPSTKNAKVVLKSVHAGADGGNDIDRWGELRELGIPALLIPEAHGGMGLSDLLGLHYWFKRCGTNRQWLGVPEFVREEANVLQGLAPHE